MWITSIGKMEKNGRDGGEEEDVEMCGSVRKLMVHV